MMLLMQIKEQTDERNKGVIFKNCAPFTDCTSEIMLK